MGPSNMSLRHQSRVAVDNFGSAPVEPEITDVQAMALARTIVSLFQRWQLDNAEACAILGGMAKPVWARWKKGRIGSPGLIDGKLRDRMALLMCIHWAVRTLFVDPEHGYAWIRNPIKSLNDESVLDYLVKGDVASIVKIRDWLYMECQLW